MNKELVKELMNEIWDRYDYASILYSDSKSKAYSVSAKGISAGQSDILCESGYVIKAYNGKRYAEYSFNELTREKFPQIMMHIDELFSIDHRIADCNGVNTYEKLEDEELKSFTENEVHNNPEELGDKAIVDKLSKIRELGLATSELIMDCQVSTSYQIYSKYFLSPKRELSQKVTWMCGYVFMMAQKGEEIKTYFESFSNLDGADILDSMSEAVDRVSSSTIDLLDSETITPGEYDCICTPDVTGMIVHEAFGHGVEMDMFVKDRALAKSYIGQYVASPIVTMHDGAAAAKEVATYDFDDEGTSSTDTVIIDKGILVTGISDAQTALALKGHSTGNGRRESFERKAYTRMTNTFFEAGQDKLEDMIASINHGYLLENASSGMEDPKNWGIQCMVNVAREIKDGKLTGKIYSPITLSGYVPDLLKSITMMSKEVKLGGSGFCGKGYKEWVKVSDGGPYIKARIKLG